MLGEGQGEKLYCIIAGSAVYVEKIEPANDKMKKPKILESHGETPAQYDEEEELY